MRVPLLIIAFLILGGTSFQGCAEPPPPRLAGIHLQKVDTLYRAGLDSLRLSIDSACAARHDNELAALVDSMLQVRREDERKMRERIGPISLENE